MAYRYHPFGPPVRYHPYKDTRCRCPRLGGAPPAYSHLPSCPTTRGLTDFLGHYGGWAVAALCVLWWAFWVFAIIYAIATGAGEGVGP